MGVFVSWIFLPIFSELKLTSVFKYFELRFNRRVRLLASGLYLFSSLIYLPVIIYVPALTFQRVTGLDTYVTVVALTVICAIYTAIGGFKAVIWTDVVQLIFMFGSLFTIIIIGIYSANGVENVIDAANRGGRLVIANYKEINSRSSIWGHVFSTSLVAVYQFGLNQTNIQRFMSFSNLKTMRISVWILAAVFSIFMILSSILGIIVYANYESCDPFGAGLIKRIDHILPHFIQDKANLFLGFSGIFIAGLFSSSLSTSSSYLNAMSGIIYEDFISQRYPRMKESTAGKVMKATVFILAVFQIILVFFIEQMGSILKIVTQCMSLNACALLTLFALGVFIPHANSKGGQFGALASIACILTLMLGSLNGVHEPTLPLRTDGCDLKIPLQLDTFNRTVNRLSDVLVKEAEENDIFWIFKINYNYYGLIGIFIGLLVGSTVSFLTGGNAIKDQKLIAKFLREKPLQEEEMILKKPIIQEQI
ncbi:sodium-coupled monocarboxylate transporter 1-like [Lutzomyia longipalpis]|uniref:sodium-coupled monocarboxylate transporter 1-like n=1 Tax=Lutzomyia longipalpis TaxID=7200 RepID=UPI002483666F|nr:sodium-coupled monocarboxylate transporter 1-like [Lutzomyia longipalpis]